MGAIIAVTAAGVGLIVLVVGLSLLTLSKGYAYKHTIDPYPNEEEENRVKLEDRQEHK